MDNTGKNYLESVSKLFKYYKTLAERATEQLNDEQLHWQYVPEANSIAIIMKHMAGNSISRWTNFLTEDGEKPWRNRDGEFEDGSETKAGLLDLWNRGWQCTFDALALLTDADLDRTIYIRTEPHTIIEAMNRHLAHITYHTGQIVHIAKMLSGGQWQALTVPKGQSAQYNQRMFGR